MKHSSNSPKESIPILDELGPIFKFWLKLTEFIQTFYQQESVTSNPPLPPFQFNHLSILDQDLYKIAYDVVEELDFLAARVAILEENGEILRARAYFVHPDLLDISGNLSYQERIEECERKVREVEKQLSMIARKKVGLKASSAWINVKDEQARENLGVRALKTVSGPRVIVDPDLFTLFTPVLPDSARSAVEKVQKRLGIYEVAAVPLIAESGNNKVNARQFVLGVLYVVSKNEISSRERISLRNFARRAANNIIFDQQYRQPLKTETPIRDVSNKKSIERQIKNLARRLQKLKEMRALKGMDLEVHYQIEIEDTEKELDRLLKKLNEYTT